MPGAPHHLVKTSYNKIRVGGGAKPREATVGKNSASWRADRLMVDSIFQAEEEEKEEPGFPDGNQWSRNNGLESDYSK